MIVVIIGTGPLASPNQSPNYHETSNALSFFQIKGFYATRKNYYNDGTIEKSLGRYELNFPKKIFNIE